MNTSDISSKPSIEIAGVKPNTCLTKLHSTTTSLNGSLGSIKYVEVFIDIDMSVHYQTFGGNHSGSDLDNVPDFVSASSATESDTLNGEILLSNIPLTSISRPVVTSDEEYTHTISINLIFMAEAAPSMF
jgi:hypothetical protein